MQLLDCSLSKETQLSNYERGQPIGTGGQAVVYGYVYPQSKELYAVKVLRWAGKQEKERELINREVQCAKDDQEEAHPHLIHALKCFNYSDEGYALVMPYFPNGDLYTVEANTKFSLVQKREVMRQLLEGLQHLHERGRIHRDLKPSNVLVREANPVSVVIIDFGQVSLSHPITYVGTLGYRAPEIKSTWGNRKPYTNLVDIYSLGMLVLWLLTPEIYQAEIPRDEFYRLQDHQNVVGQHIDTAIARFSHGREERNALLTAKRMTRYQPEKRPSAEKCYKLPWLTPPRMIMPPQKTPTRRSSRLTGLTDSSRTQSGRVQKHKGKDNPIVMAPIPQSPTKAPIPFGGMAAANANDVVKQEDFKEGLDSMEI